jgi:hypothetical protein
MGLQWVRFSHRRHSRAFVHIKQEALHIVFRDQRFGFACEGWHNLSPKPKQLTMNWRFYGKLLIFFLKFKKVLRTMVVLSLLIF